MPLFDLVRQHIKTPPYVFVVFALLAGVGNVLVMAIINNSAGVLQNALDLRTIAMFLFTIGIYVISQRGLMRLTTTEVEKMIHDLRMGLVENIGRADLLPLEQIGRSEILAGMVRDTQTISQAVSLLIVGVQSAVLIVLAMVYVFLNNTTAFVLSACFIAFALLLLLRRIDELRDELNIVFEEEHHLFDGLRDILDGFKEVKMSVPRRRAVLEEVDYAASRARDVKILFQCRSANQFVMGQTLIYLLLGVIVFVVPMFSMADPASITRTTSAMLFIIGPLGMVIHAVPMLAAANAAANNLVQLDRTLRSVAVQSQDVTERELPETFEEIRLETVSFTYKDSRAASLFTVGPFDFSVRRGEILFITGGNGSGKSTMLKLLVGLYYPDRGVIRIDRQALSPETYTAYRSLFSVIFADYHLFRKLYGLAVPDPELIDDLCRLLEIMGKIRVRGDAFDTIELSSGQRKRLAMLVTMLEDKPIVVLDEWAADQDPHFRRKFYEELLPQLKAQGKTVIAITHDDRYFDTADRCIALEEGRVAAVTHRRTPRP
jgi:putative ATP-binding cassette transporter